VSATIAPHASLEPAGGIHYNDGDRWTGPGAPTMRIRLRAWITALLAWGALAGIAAGAAQPPAAAKLAARLRAAQLPAGTSVPIWVYFTDKGFPARDKSMLPTTLVSPRSLQRRAKVRPAGKLVDATDLPLDARYVTQVEAVVGAVRQRSRWFNAVSVDATRGQMGDLAQLACVRHLDFVTRYRRNGSEEREAVPAPAPGNAPSPARKSAPGLHGATPQALDYGPSLGQLQLMGVPALHGQGLGGQGVLIGHFDDGFLRFSHHAFTSMQIVAQYDFVDHDANLAPSGGVGGIHGVQTLSVLGGFAPGALIGAAYGASFVLARTEDSGSETPLEEDNWVAAIEWADSIGIDVASTSLGYLGFDTPYLGYTWRDMNGNTTVITRAADLAAGRGILVVNSAGNGGYVTPGLNTLDAPADGDSVVAVGGTDGDGLRYYSSSVGPTTDDPPRIKPDVMAQGASVRCADPAGPDVYALGTGTSFACPLAAGVAALLLQAHPSATPMQIRDALRQTAANARTPDNLNGWGMINAPAALAYLNAAVQPVHWTDLKKAFR
jgi:serine protease AprX